MQPPATLLVLTSMVCVQLGSALGTRLFAVLTPAGLGWLRLCVAAAVLLVATRPAVRAMPAATVRATLALGAVTGLLMLMFVEAIDRIPLGTAAAVEFLGPLSVAALRAGRRSALLWPAVALAGVLALTQPWTGTFDLVGVGFALGSAASWACYLVLTQRVGTQLPGLQGLALSLTTGAVVTAPFGAWGALHGLTPGRAAQVVGIAALVPLLPFALEMLALRRVPLAVFGVLMALEPAIALLLGLVVLTQTPSAAQVLGVALVVGAGVGAQRASRRPGLGTATA